jgi:integrase
MRDLHEDHPEVPILTTHELRHTRTTLLKDAGTDLFSIARLLGHVDVNMLIKRYAHDNVETLRKTLGVQNNQA